MKLSVKQAAAIVGAAGVIAFGCSSAAFSTGNVNNITSAPGVSVSSGAVNAAVGEPKPESIVVSGMRTFAPGTVYGNTSYLDMTEDEDPAAAFDREIAEAEEAGEDSEPGEVGEITIEVKGIVPEEKSSSYVISLTDQEFDMMCAVVMSEVGYCDDTMKLAIANVIINRVQSDRFPDNVYDVLHQKNQFGAIDNYYTKRLVPDESVIDCVKRALSGEGDNIVNGATFYYTPGVSSPKAAAWFESLCFCASVGNGRFFKAW